MAKKTGVSTHPIEARMLLDELTRRWEKETARSKGPVKAMGPFVTVSRQAGSQGAAIARRLAEDLGWRVLDRELVENLASELELDPRRLELMDETRSNWFRDTIFNLLDSKLVLQDSYVSLMGRVMGLAAHRGRVIFVGRAANLILPREGGLRVRVVAPLPWRIARMGEREHIGEAAATERVSHLDAARNDFVHRHFRVSPDDPDAYDLIVDASTFGEEGTVLLIHRAMEIKGLLSGEVTPARPAAG